MSQRELIDRAGEVLREDPRVLAAWLTGSFGRGEADAFSDVDLLVVVGDEERPGFLADWEATRDSVIAFHRAIARAFLPCARALHAELGMDWPADFERATLGYLKRQLDLEIDA